MSALDIYYNVSRLKSIILMSHISSKVGTRVQEQGFLEIGPFFILCCNFLPDSKQTSWLTISEISKCQIVIEIQLSIAKNTKRYQPQSPVWVTGYSAADIFRFLNLSTLAALKASSVLGHIGRRATSCSRDVTLLL